MLRVFGLPGDFARLRAESVAEGYGHLARLEADWIAGSNRFADPGEALFAAFAGGTLVGVGGINRDPYSTNDGVGRVRRLYVSPPHRELGLGRSLVENALNAACGHFSTVRVRVPDRAAAAFYEALGFIPAPTEFATHRLEAPFA